MYKVVTCNLLAFCTVAGCALDGAGPTADPAAPDDPGDAEITSTTEQDLGPGTAVIQDSKAFYGDISAQDFWYQVGSTCKTGFVRMEGPNDPLTQWNGGGACGFAYWITPGDPHDCRAEIHAHTNGWGAGGTCDVTIHEDEEGPRSYSYSAFNTSSATTNLAPQQIVLGQGQTLTIGTTDVAGSSSTGDTYLRLFYPNKPPYFSQLADDSDDAHPPARGSLMIFTAPTSGNYVLNAGCFSNTSCSGTVTWTITP
jgi:hypothetical protein